MVEGESAGVIAGTGEDSQDVLLLARREEVPATVVSVVGAARAEAVRQNQRNTLCPVSVSVLTQKSATYLRKLLILIGLRRSAERARFELAEEFPLRQFSKLVVSATHPSLRIRSYLKSAAKIHFFLIHRHPSKKNSSGTINDCL